MILLTVIGLILITIALYVADWYLKKHKGQNINPVKKKCDPYDEHFKEIASK